MCVVNTYSTYLTRSFTLVTAFPKVIQKRFSLCMCNKASSSLRSMHLVIEQNYSMILFIHAVIWAHCGFEA